MAVHVDIIAELQKRSVDKAATELERSFNNINVPIGADVKAAEIKAAAEKIRREFSDIRAEIKVDVDKNAMGQAARGFKDVENSARGATNIIAQLGKTAFQTFRGGLSIGAPVAIDGLIQIVEQGTAATQALWLLPAAATAAAAGIGTLALATSGFADTIKDIRDPKKFAADIQMLSPAAQQAALSIQNLLPAFDKLQHATQDALFAGMGEQINRLATTYLPSIQNLTTSIAGSFNNMLTGVADQLMTPETQASIQTMFGNITQMFQNLTPAIQPLVQAFTDIATVGSGFLPGLATSISNAANSFAVFISNARESGQLQVWIQQGIDAVKNLATASWELIQIFYRVFGPETKAGIDSNIAGVSALKETVQSYNSDLTKISDIIGLVAGDTHTWSVKWNEEMLAMQGPLGSLRDGILDIPEAFAYVTNKAIDMANNVKHVLDKMAQNAAHFVDVVLPGDQSKNFTPLPDIPHVPSGGDWGGYQSTQGPFGGPGQPSLGVGGQREKRGAPSIGSGIPGAGPYPGPFAVPAVPGAVGAKPSDRERLDAIRAGLDPSLYHVDPFAPVPGMPSPGALAGGPMPGGGYGAASGQDFFEGQQKIIEQAHQLEESRKDRLALERDNQSTAEQINDAKWKEHQDEVALQKAQADLVDKTKGTAKQAKSATEELSAGLDPDLGLSKGLAGFADNMVRFAGHMALAGTMAQMQETVNADPIKGGYGLFGIRGAQNISAGLSPLLGQPITGGTDTGTNATPTLGGAVGNIATGGTRGGAIGAPRPGEDARSFAHRVMMPYWQSQGLTVGDHAADQYGEHQNGALDLMVNSLGQGQQVLQQVLSDPNVYGAIFNNQTYGYGHGTTPQDYSAGHTGDPSQDHTNHVHAFYKPGGANNITPTDPAAATGYGAGDYSAAGLGGGSIPIPLPVTIVGGGMGGGLPGLGSPAGAASGAGGGNGWGAATPAATGGLNWDALAQPEAGGNWGNKSNPKYRGGLQFDIPTWNQFKPAGAPADPADAAKEMQIAAAQNALNSGRTPQSLWPQNYAQLGTPVTPASGGGIPAVGGGQAGGPGPSMALGTGLGVTPAGAGQTTPYGGVEPPSNPGGGGMGITPGGTLDSAISAAASAADVFAPGAGQAAQTGIKLANRAVQYGGQMAGHAVEGLMQTFLPTGGSELANNSWLTRIVGGLAGASPQIPNTAGGQGGQPPGPLTPQQVTSGGAPGVGNALGAPITVNYQNNGAPEDRAGRDIAHNLGQMNQPTAVAGHR